MGSGNSNERHVFECNCGRGKKCPEMVRDGGGIVLTEATGELVAYPDGRQGVKFSREQAQELRRELEKWGF